MYAFGFRLRSFDEHSERTRAAVLLLLLEALIAHDIAYLRDHPDTPPLFRSGVRYRLDDRAGERWKDIAEVRAGGVGDCKDLAAWRLAELRLWGEYGAVARVSFFTIAGRVVNHVTVRRADGHIEDPSLALR